jgi:imidazole glycerol-phosphate synthase subunit HisH
VSDILIIRTGSANIASVLAAFRRAGASARTTDSPDEVARAAAVVLPGVGAFGPAMEHLRSRDLDAALNTRIAAGRPLLCICLGLQLLCEASDESPGIRGLGVLPSTVRRFPTSVRTPHIGWNTITPDPETSLLRPGHAWFANSYRLESCPPGWSAATSEHGGRFIAALQRGPILACQFHPELSGEYGQHLLERWMQLTLTTEVAPC